MAADMSLYLDKLRERTRSSAFSVVQGSLVRLFLAMDYTVNLLSGYSCRSGWKRAAAIEDKRDGDAPIGRVVTTFGHPLLDENRVFLHNSVACRLVRQGGLYMQLITAIATGLL